MRQHRLCLFIYWNTDFAGSWGQACIQWRRQKNFQRGAKDKTKI